MKKIILISILLLSFSACTGTINSENSINTTNASEMSQLKSALDSYSSATINNDVNRLLSFVYPKVFTLISKNEMRRRLTKVYASNQAPHITDISYKKISSIDSYDRGLYSVIDSKMTMELISPILDNNKLELLLYEKLKSQMGNDAEIIHDKQKHMFTVKKSTQIIGIKEGVDSWKFVGYEQAKRYSAKRIIPKSIMDKLK